MKTKEMLKLMYEKSVEQHLFLLNWRYRLIAGYIAILGALIFFLINHDDYIIHSCIAGIIITIIIIFLSARTTVLYWKDKNNAYYFEKELVRGKGFEGLYSLKMDFNDKKNDIDALFIAKELGNENEYKRLWDKLYGINNALSIIDFRLHIGAINCVYYLCLLGFMLKLMYEINIIIHCGFHCT